MEIIAYTIFDFASREGNQRSHRQEEIIFERSNSSLRVIKLFPYRGTW